MSKATEERLDHARSNLETARRDEECAQGEVERLRRVMEAAREKLIQARRDAAAARNRVKSHVAIVADLYDKNRISQAAAAQRKAKALADEYEIVIEQDHDSDHEQKWWVSCPEWLDDRNDPVVDGHFAFSWDSVLVLVEIYAKHSPHHPDHDGRQYGVVGPDA